MTETTTPVPRGRSFTALARAGVRGAARLAAGAGTALLTLFFLIGAGPLYVLTPRPRRASTRLIRRGARALTGLELRRLGRPGREHAAPPVETGRLIRYLAAHVPVGLLGGAVLALTGFGIGSAAVMVGAWLAGSANTTATDVLILVAPGLVLLYLAVHGLVRIAETDRALSRRMLGPDPREVLRRRVDELAASRAGVVEAVHEERRRIERDLHDGVQQRLVALGMLLGRARRGSGDSARTDELLRQAHEQAQQALTDLRDVAWRIHPTGLDDGGLHAVLETLTERAPLRVDLSYEVAREPAPILATAVYFVVAEAVTNTVKHALADAVAVTVSRHGEGADDVLCVRIVDDGIGGADPAGGGLSGLARRIAALDGTLRVDSPLGGPTTITAEVPCG
ncbi:histidine kinase [Streptomyces sp. SID3343]|uniref:sensor histidine kinase n=1 Tax=Streptomyces sp. SID3343 TaxID=2690260 RepID=UPI00136D2920|nr:histidine kinase [Streptomyces sp. SID3343]MYV99820.1 sensor histidine kinase [Streptomyces sp. SID3343]